MQKGCQTDFGRWTCYVLQCFYRSFKRI